MNDNLIFFAKLKMTSSLIKMEDNLNLNINRTQPHFVVWINDNLSFLLGNAVLTNPSLSRAWHSSAPACLGMIPKGVQGVKR